MNWSAAEVAVGFFGLIGLITVPIAAHGHFAHWLEKDPAYRRKVALSLTSNGFLEGYRRTLGYALSLLTRVLGDPGSLRGTIKGITACYLIATCYSALFFFVSWLFGGPAELGNFGVLPDSPMWIRAVWIIAVLLVVTPFFLAARRNFSVNTLEVAVVILASLISSVGIFINPVFTFGFFMIVGSFALILIISDTQVGPMTAIIVLAVSALGMGFLLIVMLLFSVTIILTGSDARFGNPILPIFVTVLPAANMLLDWSSWLVSRLLGAHLLDQTLGCRTNFANVLIVIIHALIDLVTAIAFLFLLAFVLPCVIEAFSLWGGEYGMSLDLNLRAFIDEAVSDPWPNAIWITLMLLSTLLPTLLHAGALVASPLALWLPTNRSRAEIALALVKDDAPQPWAIRAAAWFEFKFWLIATITPIAVLTLLISIVYFFTGGVSKHLVWAAEIGIWLAHYLVGR